MPTVADLVQGSLGGPGGIADDTPFGCWAYYSQHDEGMLTVVTDIEAGSHDLYLLTDRQLLLRGMAEITAGRSSDVMFFKTVGVWTATQAVVLGNLDATRPLAQTRAVRCEPQKFQPRWLKER